MFDYCPRPVEAMRKWLNGVIGDNVAALEFATWDSRTSRGAGGKYHILFRVSEPTDDFEVRNGVFLTLRAGAPKPIEAFSFLFPDISGLKWLQGISGEEELQHQVLIAPRSVKDWPGQEDETEVPIARHPGRIPRWHFLSEPPRVHPLGTKVGLPGVDLFLEVVYGGNLSRLAQHARFSERACDASLSLRCSPGDPKGTIYAYVPVDACARNFAFSAQELEAILEEIEGEGRQYLYAVSEPGLHRSKYGVVLRSSTYLGRTFYIDAEGRLMGIDSCRLWPPDHPESSTILSPVS
jgi:hypothetical protein